MAGCPTMIYEGVTQQGWDCLLNRARTMGFTVPAGNSGTVSSRDVTVRYEWDPETGRLAVTVVRKPFEISCAQIELGLVGAVRLCGGR